MRTHLVGICIKFWGLFVCCPVHSKLKIFKLFSTFQVLYKYTHNIHWHSWDTAIPILCIININLSFTQTWTFFFCNMRQCALAVICRLFAPKIPGGFSVIFQHYERVVHKLPVRKSSCLYKILRLGHICLWCMCHSHMMAYHILLKLWTVSWYLYQCREPMHVLIFSWCWV